MLWHTTIEFYANFACEFIKKIQIEMLSSVFLVEQVIIFFEFDGVPLIIYFLVRHFTSIFKEITHNFVEQWATERADRLAGEQIAKAAQAKSEDEICELRDKLERAQRDSNKRGMSHFIIHTCFVLLTRILSTLCL